MELIQFFLPLSRFTIFSILLVVTLLALQYLLYRRTASFLRATRMSPSRKENLQLALKAVLLTMNLPWLFIVEISILYGEPVLAVPDMLGDVAPYLMYPLTIWHLGSLVTLLSLVSYDLLRASWRLGRRWARLGVRDSRLGVRDQELGIREALQTTNPDPRTPTPELRSPNPDPRPPTSDPRIPNPASPITRRQFVQTAGVSLASVPYLASTYGAILAADHVVIERVTIPIKNLPDPLVGLKIVQLTDIHVGIFMPEHRLREYAAVVNRLEPDLILLTGDYVSSSEANVAPFLRAASHLRAKYGVFGCAGNHDLFTRSVPLLISGFPRYGMKLLYNEQVWLNVDGARLNLIGIEFLSRIAQRFDQVIRGLSLDGPSILLSHHPNTFPQAASKAIDLTLAGHTHGGQVKVELLGFNLSPARLITPYAAGLFEISESKLYVSRGLGTTGPPIRFGAPPEITLITLKR